MSDLPVIARKVCNAVKALNAAIDEASAAGLYVELTTTRTIGSRNQTYIVSVMERRERVLPS